MKLIRSLSIITALAVIVPTAVFAAEKKAKKEGAAPAAEAAKAGKAGKPLPMNSRVDSIDTSAKTFTMKRKDGVEIKHVLAATAEVKNGPAAAKFEDIKVGDYVAGLRNKKSDTEYEVVKITKFGPAAPKKAKEGDAAKKPEKKKE